MSYLGTINGIRRKITKSITNNIGQSKATQSGNFAQIDASTVKKILISRPNHRLGNMLLITPIVQEIATIFPNAKVDIFVKGTVANVIFENYDNVGAIISLPKKHFKQLNHYLSGWFRLKKQKYDLVINCIEYSSSGKLSTQFANGKHKYFGALDINAVSGVTGNALRHAAKKTIFGLRTFLSKSGVTIKENAIPTLNLKLSADELAAGKNALQQILKTDQKTISLFTYATGNKCYPETWWNDFYSALQLHFPEYAFIEILPVENISMLNFTIPTFYSKDVRAIAGVIANTSLFIGADSGMMHLASASQATTIGLFSVTDVNTYSPYGNGSTAIDTNINSTEDSMKIVGACLKNQ
jgi:ADP-heptose:LPS heptosyltransferase